MYIKQNFVCFMVSRYIYKVITVVITSNMFIETIRNFLSQIFSSQLFYRENECICIVKRSVELAFSF